MPCHKTPSKNESDFSKASASITIHASTKVSITETSSRIIIVDVLLVLICWLGGCPLWLLALYFSILLQSLQFTRMAMPKISKVFFDLKFFIQIAHPYLYL